MSDFDEFRQKWLAVPENAQAYIEVADEECTKLYLENAQLRRELTGERKVKAQICIQLDAAQADLYMVMHFLHKIYDDDTGYYEPEIVGMIGRIIKSVEKHRR